jgi:hypothetical protein
MAVLFLGGELETDHGDSFDGNIDIDYNTAEDNGFSSTSAARTPDAEVSPQGLDSIALERTIDRQEGSRRAKPTPQVPPKFSKKHHINQDSCLT